MNNLFLLEFGGGGGDPRDDGEFGRVKVLDKLLYTVAEGGGGGFC